MRVEDSQDKVKRNQFRTHCVRFEIAFALNGLTKEFSKNLFDAPFSVQVLHRQFTERTEDQKRVLYEQVIGGNDMPRSIFLKNLFG